MAKIGERVPITKANINMIAGSMGIGSMLLDLHMTDYSRGAMQTGEHEKSFWLIDGRKVTISMAGGGFIASVTQVPDPDIPDPL